VQQDKEPEAATTSPCFFDEDTPVLSRYTDLDSMKWDFRVSTSDIRMGLRLAVTHNDNRLDKVGGKLLSSPCAQRA